MKKFTFIIIFILIFCFTIFTQTQSNSNCPEIKVTGPSSSIIHSGETIIFTVNVNDIDLNKISYQWSVSDGTIIEGQGTPVIYVDTSGASKTEIAVTVKINNLPDGCADSVSEKVELCKFCGTPITLDEYGKISWRDEKTRLKIIADELRERENSAALFMIYYTAKDNRKTLKSRILRIENFLVIDNKIPKEKVGFIFAGAEESERTRIYLAPAELEVGKSNWENNLNELKLPPMKN